MGFWEVSSIMQWHMEERRRLQMKGSINGSERRRAYGIREFAELFGISLDMAKRAAKGGYLRTIRLGGRVLVPIDEIDRIQHEGMRGTPRKLGER
jgi:hypothetical protein